MSVACFVRGQLCRKKLEVAWSTTTICSVSLILPHGLQDSAKMVGLENKTLTSGLSNQ